MSRFRRGPGAPLLERQLQRRIVVTLESWGVAIDSPRASSGTTGGSRAHAAGDGFPDLVGFMPWGQYVAIEVKLPGGKLRPEQARWFIASAKQSEWALLVVADSIEEITPLRAMCARWGSWPETIDWFLTFHRARWQTMRDHALELARAVVAKEDAKRERELTQRRPGRPEDLFAAQGRRVP